MSGKTASVRVLRDSMESQTKAEDVQKRSGQKLGGVGIDATAASTSLKVSSPRSKVADRQSSDESGCSWAKLSNSGESYQFINGAFNENLEKLQHMMTFPPPPHIPSCSGSEDMYRPGFKCDSAMFVGAGKSREANGCGCVLGAVKGFWKKLKKRKSGCKSVADNGNNVEKGREHEPDSQRLGNIPNGVSLHSRPGNQCIGLERAKRPPATKRHYRKASMQHRCNMIEMALSGDSGDHAQLAGLHRRCVSWDNAMDSMLVGIKPHGSAKSLHGDAMATRPGSRSRSRSDRSRSDGSRSTSSKPVKKSEQSLHGHRRCSSAVHRPPSNLTAVAGSAMTLPQQTTKVNAVLNSL